VVLADIAASHAALFAFTGRFVIGVFQTLLAGNIGQFEAPGTVVALATSVAFVTAPAAGDAKLGKSVKGTPAINKRRSAMAHIQSRSPCQRAPLGNDHGASAKGVPIVVANISSAALTTEHVRELRQLDPLLTRQQGG
jgi:hypothetical protein